MAGQGYKDFTAGAVLTAAQVDGYLMEQAVMNFAGTAARGSALSSVQSAGMMAHVGGGTVTVYDGSAWQQVYPAQAGLVYIAGTAFSAVSSVSVNNCFTSTYENYRIILSSKNTATLETRFRFRAAGTDNTALTYTWSAVGGALGSASTLYVTRANGGDYFPIIQAAAADAPNHVSMDLHGPALSTTRHGVTAQVFDGPGVGVYSGGGGQYSAAAFDGFTIYTSTSTITGTVRIYGYRNS